MAILFMGGEQIDFVQFYNNTVMSTAIDRHRGDYSRGSVSCAGSTTDHMNYAYGRFTQSSSDFWFTAQLNSQVFQALAPGFLTFLSFWDGAAKRFGIQMNDQRQLRLVRYADGVTQSVLTTTTTVAIQNDGTHKLDVHMTYGNSPATGHVQVYVDQVKVLDYSGDITAGGSASLNGFGISCFNTNSSVACYWSEMVALERDTRTLSLKTHTPVSTAANSEWTGTFDDIDEVIPDDGNVITTAGLDKTARFGVSALPTNNLSVRGFKVSARVSRGVSGPLHIALGVTSGSDSALSPDFNVDTGWGAVSQTFETHPNTGSTWTEADINGIEIDLKSRA